MQRHTRTQMRGFTLLEIMVVIVIIGILASLVLTNVLSNVDKAHIAKAKQDIQAFRSALDMFKLDNFKYPTSEQGLKALVQQPNDPSIRNWRQGGYIDRLEKDPWGYDYHYVYPGAHGKEYDLFTLGADNQEGGEGDNADVTNWSTE
jgi:general secretion pathway protein G